MTILRRPSEYMYAARNVNRRRRLVYVSMAVLAFCLALVAGDIFFIAASGFFLVASLTAAAIARRLERREAP